MEHSSGPIEDNGSQETADRQTFLASVVPFHLLPPAEIETIAPSLNKITHEKDDTLFVQEETVLAYILILRAGRLERIIEESGQQVDREIIQPGGIFGGISFLFNNRISTSTVCCVEKASIYRLDCETFLRLCIQHPAFGRHFSRAVDRGRQTTRAVAESGPGQPGDKSLTDSFLWKTIGDIAKAFPSCLAGTSIRQAAAILTASHRSAILVLDEKSNPLGIVTDYDLRKKVIVEGRSPEEAIQTIMTSRLIQVDAQSQVFEAVLTMIRNSVNHLALSRDGRIEGIITERDLSLAGAYSPIFMVHQIQSAGGVDELRGVYAKLSVVIHNLISSGARGSYLNRIITAITDAVLTRVIGMALQSMGPAPAQFAFLLLGSEGRKEQTLKTDQDNAIVYEDAHGEDQAGTREYFLGFGKRVCDWLDEIGQKHCEFEIMAKNPAWCQPLSVWKEYYRRWILSDDPDRILKASIFFDFRLGYGTSKLVETLHATLFENLNQWPTILRHMARNTLNYRPPLGFFGNFIVQDRGKDKERLDLKSAMRLLVDFGRIYAMKASNTETNTLKRLQALYMENRMDEEETGDMVHAYEFLMFQRLRHQSESIKKNDRQPDNFLRPADLSAIDQQALKEAFKQIRIAQAKIRLDFSLYFS